VMFVIPRSPGQAVRIGACTLRVVAIHAGEVVLALFDPEEDCAGCGERPAERRPCSVCRAETVVCTACAPQQRCPKCASALA
jgi:hypothetical protein